MDYVWKVNFMNSIKIGLQTVIDAIEAEPDLPENNAFIESIDYALDTGDSDFLVTALKIAIKKIKENIHNRIIAGVVHKE